MCLTIEHVWGFCLQVCSLHACGVSQSLSLTAARSSTRRALTGRTCVKALGAVARPVAKPWYRGDANGEPPMSASRKRSLKEPRRVPPMLSWLALRPRWLHATCALLRDRA